MATPALGGAKYLVLFIDDFSRYTETYTIKRKFKVIDCFRQFKAKVENQQGRKIKRFQSDGRGEYTGQEFTKLLEHAGIVREVTAPYTSEQNGVAERANRKIIGRAKAMIYEAGLADTLWGEVVHTAMYLKNRSPTSTLETGITPLEAFTGEKPNLADLIPFGAKGFKHVSKKLWTKLEPNSIPCTFVEYAGTNQFRVLVDRKIQITRDLVLTKEIPDNQHRKPCPSDDTQLVPITSSDDESDDMSRSSRERMQEPASQQPEFLESENITPTPQTPSRNYTPGEFPVTALRTWMLSIYAQQRYQNPHHRRRYMPNDHADKMRESLHPQDSVMNSFRVLQSGIAITSSRNTPHIIQQSPQNSPLIPMLYPGQTANNGKKPYTKNSIPYLTIKPVL